MCRPEYPDGCQEAVRRDEAEHADAEREAEEGVALWDRVERAESRVTELEKCVKAMVDVPRTMLACSDKIEEPEREVYRKACRYTSARLKEWQKVYNVKEHGDDVDG